MSQLNNSGLPSNRNKAKQYRHQRVMDNPDGTTQIHPEDRMRLGTHGQEVNSTGSFGVKSTFAVRVKQYGPKGGRRKDSRAKNVARTFSKGQLIKSKLRMIPRILEVRAKIMTIKTVMDFRGKVLREDFARLLREADRMLLNECDQKIVDLTCDQDEQRERSLMGRLNSEGSRRIDLNGMTGEIEFAMKQLNRW